MTTGSRLDPLVVSDRELALEVLRSAEKLIVVTHEHPDGDALGSLVAAQQLLTGLGKDSLMFIAKAEFPLPYEYQFLPLDGLVTMAPSVGWQSTELTGVSPSEKPCSDVVSDRTRAG